VALVGKEPKGPGAIVQVLDGSECILAEGVIPGTLVGTQGKVSNSLELHGILEVDSTGSPTVVRILTPKGNVVTETPWGSFTSSAAYLSPGDSISINLSVEIPGLDWLRDGLLNLADVFEPEALGHAHSFEEEEPVKKKAELPSLRIGKVLYRNFGPFDTEEFDFSLPGLTGIDGVIVWKPGSNSNGSGKSMLYDGVSWCLFGRGIRSDFKGDDVVRIGSKSGTFVRVCIDGGPEPITVTRYRRHPQHKNHLYLQVGTEDVTRGTDAETQQAVETLLGIDFHTFCNSVAFGAREDIRSFFAAPDAERKQILERILGLELYAQAQSVAKVRLGIFLKEIGELEVTRGKAQTALEQIQHDWQVLQAGSDPEALELERDVTALRYKRLSAAVATRKGRVGKAEDDLLVAQANAQADQEAFEALLVEYEELFASLDSEAQAAKQHAVATNANAQQLKKRLTALEGLEGECPTCTQPVTDELKHKARGVLGAEIDQHESSRDEALGSAEKLESQRDDLEQPLEPQSPAVALAEADVEAEQAALQALEVKLATAKAEAKTADDRWAVFQQQQGTIDAQVEEKEAAIEKADEKLGVLKDGAARLEFWVEGFGHAGLKSFLIEAEIPAINKRATAYAQVLLGAGAKVRLQATTKLKSKDVTREKLTVEGGIPGCCSSYAGASKGQKRRLDLALLLAFREIVGQRSAKSFRQFMADELFDGLDKAGCESVVSLLQEIAAECPVTLVTHSPWLKSAVDRTVTVRHLEEFRATLVPQKSPSGLKKKLKKKLAPKTEG